MKLLHLSDLHLGKRVNEFSMLDDQQFILKQILNVVDEQRPCGVIIAGDVFDKTVPPAQAMRLFDDFLFSLSERDVHSFVISGNHDSPERIAFGGRLMGERGAHLSPVYNGEVRPITLKDEFGEVNIYLLPFIKPAHVRAYFPNEQIDSYTDALEIAVRSMNINPSERNLLVNHQFVTGASRSDSEELSVGGSDNVDAKVFAAFDYVALGHIHRPQNAGSPAIRYCGTPLKYSFSEAADKKSISVVELFEKGRVNISEIPLTPLHELRELRGDYMTLTAKSTYEGTPTDDYIHITLTDELDIPDALGKLRTIYPNLMKLDYDNQRTRSDVSVGTAFQPQQRSPLELFEELYEKQNAQKMSDTQRNFALGLIESIWEDGQ